ncbi:T9SS type A sorting domain-containing protein, partial [bacterium]|nr:T9SS type A sorting domain-containing protein [bacterium]
IPEQSQVTLEIYNILGEKVMTLIDEQMQAGYHSALWDGRDSLGRMVSGGIYICRIQAGNYQQTMRMLLMK